MIEPYRRVTGRSVDSSEFYRLLSGFRTAIVYLELFERYRLERGPNLRCIGFDTIGFDTIGARPARLRFRHRPRARRVTSAELNKIVARVLQLE